MSLAFIALFSYATISYINAHANSQAYFGEFYAADLASTNQLVRAGYGDVVLRYDNLRTNLDLMFWTDNGKVTVGAANEQRIQPTDAITRTYRPALSYPTGAAVYHDPYYLVIRKHDGAMDLAEAETALKSCTMVETPSVGRKDAKIYASYTPEASNPLFLQTLKEELAPFNIIVVEKEEDANIVVQLTVQTQPKDSIWGATLVGEKDAESLECLFRQQVQASTLIAFTESFATDPKKDAAIEVRVLLRHDEKKSIDPKETAKSLAKALEVYLR
jgi:hypothetical protein